MIISAYSDRIYKKDLQKWDCFAAQSMLIDCNDIKYELASKIARGKLSVDELNTTKLIEEYHVNTYYANMIIREVKALVKSQDELKPRYIEETEVKIIEQEAKIKRFQEKLDYWRNMKAKCINYPKDGKHEFVFPYSFGGKKVIHCTGAKGKEKTVYEPWQFELYAEKRIRQIKNMLYHAKNKLYRLKQKLKKLELKRFSVCFGSKAFFKKQFTVDKYVENHDLWYDEFNKRRHHRFVISGCSGYTDGSMCVRYNRDFEVLNIMSHRQGNTPSGQKYTKSQWFSIPCYFKYREAEYLKAIDNKETMAYEIMDFGDYFIVKAVFELKDETPLMNDGSGIVSIDINIDRYAVTVIDKKANLVKRKVIYFDLDSLSSQQATKVLENAAIEVSEICKAHGLPLVREDIKDIKFKDTGDKKHNKQLTQFAYDKMISTIDRRLNKDGFTIYKVDPKFTSKQGKLKYMAPMGLSIHESAAYTIGRRFMLNKKDKDDKTILYYEDLKQYKRFGSIKKLAKHLNKLSVNTMYRLDKIPVKLDNYKTFNKYVEAVNEYIYGKKK